MQLVTDVYKLVKLLPKEETYALSDQMRRAAVSIPSNIAEGQKRSSDRDFAHFLSLANGSCGELETQLILANRLEMLTMEQVQPVIDQCEEIERMLHKFIHNLQSK